MLKFTVSELASTVNDSILLKNDFNKYNQDLQKKFYTLNRNNKNIINQLSNLTKILDRLNINIATNDIPSTSQTQEDNVSTTTRRDDDNDVIVRNAFSNRY